MIPLSAIFTSLEKTRNNENLFEMVKKKRIKCLMTLNKMKS